MCPTDRNNVSFGSLADLITVSSAHVALIRGLVALSALGESMAVKSSTGRACRVCADPRLDQIETDLVRPGTNRRALARKYGIGRMSILRHEQLHLPERVQRAAEAAKSAPVSQRTLEQVAELNKLARAIFTRGYNDANLTAAVSALRELRKIVEFEGRLLGTVKEAGAQINIDISLDREALARMAGAYLAIKTGKPQRRKRSVPRSKSTLSINNLSRRGLANDRRRPATGGRATRRRA